MPAAPRPLGLAAYAPSPVSGGLRTHVAAWAGVLLAHGVAGWGLMQLDTVRQTVSAARPISVHLITDTPEPLPAPPLPLPPPQPQTVRARTPPLPAPLIAARPRPLTPPEPQAYAVPSAPPEPVPPAAPVLDTPPAPPAPHAPAAPSPKLISASDIRCPTPADAAYPQISQQLGETGTVRVRVLIDAQGRPQEVVLHQSSGHPRLDRAALAGAHALRCKPYTEAGVAQAVWVVAPIDFQME